MPTTTPARDFLLPRLNGVVDAAQAQGFERQVVVAVLIDLITAPGFDTAAPPRTADSEPHPDYERSPADPPMVHGVVPAGPPMIGAQDEADFLLPPRWDR